MRLSEFGFWRKIVDGQSNFPHFFNFNSVSICYRSLTESMPTGGNAHFRVLSRTLCCTYRAFVFKTAAKRIDYLKVPWKLYSQKSKYLQVFNLNYFLSFNVISQDLCQPDQKKINFVFKKPMC